MPFRCVCPPHTHTEGAIYRHFSCIDAEANSSHLVLSSGVMSVCHEQSPSAEHLMVNLHSWVTGLCISARGIDGKWQTESSSTPHPHSLVPFDVSWGPCRLSGLGLGVAAMCSYTTFHPVMTKGASSPRCKCVHSPMLYLFNYLDTFVLGRKNRSRASKVYR